VLGWPQDTAAARAARACLRAQVPLVLVGLQVAAGQRARRRLPRAQQEAPAPRARPRPRRQPRLARRPRAARAAAGAVAGQRAPLARCSAAMKADREPTLALWSVMPRAAAWGRTGWWPAAAPCRPAARAGARRRRKPYLGPPPRTRRPGPGARGGPSTRRGAPDSQGRWSLEDQQHVLGPRRAGGPSAHRHIENILLDLSVMLRESVRGAQEDHQHMAVLLFIQNARSLEAVQEALPWQATARAAARLRPKLPHAPRERSTAAGSAGNCGRSPARRPSPGQATSPCPARAYHPCPVRAYHPALQRRVPGLQAPRLPHDRCALAERLPADVDQVVPECLQVAQRRRGRKQRRPRARQLRRSAPHPARPCAAARLCPCR